MTAYYNEFKPEAAHMLRQLIKDGLIAGGDVDERSITEVKPDDLIGYNQCHFFAGIGGWSVALRLAGWPDDRPVWTGSCPCQPFSTAGKQKGKADERHLWPVWFNLIRECKPSIVFGEQVAAAITHGWWDDVANDMEAEDYACGSAVLPACSVGAPHRRDRLWFVANTANIGGDERKCRNDNSEGRGNEGAFGADGSLLYVAHPEKQGLEGHGQPFGNEQGQSISSSTMQWIECPDGKQRPVEPGIRLLAHGVPNRTHILHAFGNAIVPQVAAEFIKASGILT